MKRILAAVALVALITGIAAAWLRGASTHPAAITELVKVSSSTLGPVSAKLIAQDDLPPAGTRSLFDHVLAQNDGLPWPFEKLVSLVQRQAPEGSTPLAVMIPMGRSLLKASADFAHPRVVFAADYQGANTAAALGIAPRGQLFLGFTENAHEIEVISYNEAAGRFEFQLVQNYCQGCVPRIVYARRAICQTCHQGGSPIFSVRPWQETNGQPEIARRIVEARGDQPYLAVAPEQPLSTPERIDELTDIGNFINITQRIWLDGCGAQGVECRRLMLKLGLRFADDPAAFDAEGADAQQLRALQAAQWPAQGIPVPDNDLVSRDPLQESHSLKTRLRALLPGAKDPIVAAKDNEDLEAFEKLPKLPPLLDPLSPRAPKRVLSAQDLDGVSGLAQFFTEADRELLLRAAGGSWSAVLEGVDRLPASFFAAAPFSRVRSLQALLAPSVIVSAKPAPARTVPVYCCLDTAEMSPPLAAGAPPLALAAGSVLRPFEAHCFACHRGNPAQRLNFMGGATEAEVLASIKAKTEIRDALDWSRYQGTDKANKLMPPADSAQHAALQAELAQNPQLLEQMRAVVPSLFDF